MDFFYRLNRPSMPLPQDNGDYRSVSLTAGTSRRLIGGNSIRRSARWYVKPSLTSFYRVTVFDVQPTTGH
jgi:hypothetical protein